MDVRLEKERDYAPIGRRAAPVSESVAPAPLGRQPAAASSSTSSVHAAAHHHPHQQHHRRSNSNGSVPNPAPSGPHHQHQHQHQHQPHHQHQNGVPGSASVPQVSFSSGPQQVSFSHDPQPEEDDKESTSNISVCVRLRPMLSKEIAMGQMQCVNTIDKVVVVTDPGHDEDDVLRAKRVHEKRYAFDHVFPERMTNEQVFAQTTLGLIGPLMRGFNATVFAYGATGAGKTYTMLGDNEHPGVMVLTLRQLFREIDATADNFSYDLSMSYLEIYNENIRDLLIDSSDYLDLREDPQRGPIVAGITEVKASNVAEVMSLLQEGNLRRTQEPTKANETSSRSHAILQVTVSQRERTAGVSHLVRVGKLSLVDLAGSERASQTENRGMRMIEASNINKSLLALANCISSLSDKSKRGSYINFRDSKLTRILKDSLGGACKTVMIANVSPAAQQYEETHNTLKYANRAKDIKTTIRRNIRSVEYHISQYNQIIADLRQEILDLKGRLGGLNTSRGGSRAPSVDPYELADRAEAQRVRAQLTAYFDAHMQLRRAMTEVKEQNSANAVEMERLKLEIRVLEDDYEITRDELVGSQLLEAQEALRVIGRNTQANEEILAEMNAKIAVSKVMGRDLETLVPGDVNGEERREIIEMEYRIRVMEMESLELEAQASYERNQSALKDLLVQELHRRLDAKDRVIARLRARLDEANIAYTDDDSSSSSSSSGGEDEDNEVENEDLSVRSMSHHDALSPRYPFVPTPQDAQLQRQASPQPYPDQDQNHHQQPALHDRPLQQPPLGNLRTPSQQGNLPTGFFRPSQAPPIPASAPYPRAPLPPTVPAHRRSPRDPAFCFDTRSAPTSPVDGHPATGVLAGGQSATPPGFLPVVARSSSRENISRTAKDLSIMSVDSPTPAPKASLNLIADPLPAPTQQPPPASSSSSSHHPPSSHHHQHPHQQYSSVPQPVRANRAPASSGAPKAPTSFQLNGEGYNQTSPRDRQEQRGGRQAGAHPVTGQRRSNEEKDKHQPPPQSQGMGPAPFVPQLQIRRIDKSKRP